MIPQISEINFPSYATLHKATVSMSDMGDKVISTEVKIDGSIRPEFVGRTGTTAHGEDWEIEFLGERYIQPLRQPQAKKDNESINSMIDLNFYHWAIYQLKRYFFVALANIQSGTPIVDSYIVPLAVNLPEFAKALDDVLAYYIPDRSVYVYKSGESYINPDFTGYDHNTKYVEIDHTYIWEVLQKTYELFNCRWTIEKDENDKYAIKFGYPTGTEIAKVFQYGYDGGLLSFQRQVQDDSIRNLLLGRGGEKNLPYMYFKDYEKFHPNSTDSAYKNYGLPDPDAIPELENILFSELRDKNFRSYVQGWKVNTHRIASTTDGWSVTWNADGTDFYESDGSHYSLDTARLTTDWAYAKGATDELFNPVEYVKDDASIEAYGLLQGGLDNNDDIFPTIQGMKIIVPCSKGAHDSLSAGHTVETLADEIVDVEEVITDEIKTAEETAHIDNTIEVYGYGQVDGRPSLKSFSRDYGLEVRINGDSEERELKTANFTIEDGFHGGVSSYPELSATFGVKLYGLVCTAPGEEPVDSYISQETKHIALKIKRWKLYNAATDSEVANIGDLAPGNYYFKIYFNWDTQSFKLYDLFLPGETYGIHFYKVLSRPGWIDVNATATVKQADHGDIILMNLDDDEPIHASSTISAHSVHTFTLNGDTFTVPAGGALNVGCPVEVSPSMYAVKETTVKILNTDTSEYVVNSNIPAGNYQLKVEVKVENTDSSSHEFTVKLGTALVYLLSESDEWQPTFDIWIKNIFNTNRADYSSDDVYMEQVWGPLISQQDMVVTFATGNLSRHSDWEFRVHKIAYDNNKTVGIEDNHEVRSEWRLTLIKSDAEADAIHKYVPYKDFNAAPKDRFILTNLYLPWSYVFAAENELNSSKESELEKSKDSQPTWVVGIDKVRLRELDMLWSIKTGDKLWIKDNRFTVDTGVQVYVQSLTYTWQGDGEMTPDIEVVLSDKVETALTTVERIQGEISTLSNQVKGLSALEQEIRKVGDAVYLRKDGFEETTYSPTNVAKRISSRNYRRGILGGEGWGADVDADGNSLLEVDVLNVRKEMNVNNLVINQVSAIGGKEILSAASIEVTNVVAGDDGYVCYFNPRQGSIGNLFVVDDVALSQIYDKENNLTKYYKRKVVAVDVDSITLSYDIVDGDGAPSVGDVIAQYGNYTDAQRRFVIIRDVIGGGYERMLSGLDSVTATGNEYYFAGALDNPTTEEEYLIDKDDKTLIDKDDLVLVGRGQKVVHNIIPRWFVGNANSDYAEWINGVLTIRGVLSVKGSDNAYHALSGVVDGLDYLQEALEQTTIISGGLVLSTLIGVKDGNDLVAGLNASNLGYDSGNNGHGTLMIFAGVDSTQSTLDAKVANSKFRVYEDGTLFSTQGVISAFNFTGSNFSAYEDNTDHVTNFIMGPAQLTYHMNSQGAGASNTYYSHIGLDIRPNPSSNTLLNLQSYSKTDRSNIALSILAQHSTVRDDINHPYDNFAIHCARGLFGGFRPAYRVIPSSSTRVNLLDNDVYNLLITGDNANLYLPEAPQDGAFFIMYHTSQTNDVSISPQGSDKISRYGSSSTGARVHQNSSCVDFFTYRAYDQTWYMMSLPIA